ncbi:hypothetical protein C8035_v000676 [Colletotrichum spinosum]|uniref:Uncharacterized protein n=2 Tax=Colletotrichum orbiculare species complex TaxID=2707354 RepID=A0A4R8RKN7_COLTR|nr:hypothetical protein C8035_v000676 [Colletotrichum spinosum]TDZ61481.1 hypothetical protein CTRI78_v004343 [Colletotrichum trifolii]
MTLPLNARPPRRVRMASDLSQGGVLRAVVRGTNTLERFATRDRSRCAGCQGSVYRMIKTTDQTTFKPDQPNHPLQHHDGSRRPERGFIEPTRPYRPFDMTRPDAVDR